MCNIGLKFRRKIAKNQWRLFNGEVRNNECDVALAGGVNVILAAEFASIFDGFSIGSNDLTQLILGVDRDSEIVAPIFDERNAAVKTMIASVISSFDDIIKPDISDPYASSIALTLSNLLRHVRVRARLEPHHGPEDLVEGEGDPARGGDERDPGREEEEGPADRRGGRPGRIAGGAAELRAPAPDPGGEPGEREGRLLDHRLDPAPGGRHHVCAADLVDEDRERAGGPDPDEGEADGRDREVPNESIVMGDRLRVGRDSRGIGRDGLRQ